MLLFGFIIRIYHDARPPERQIWPLRLLNYFIAPAGGSCSLSISIRAKISIWGTPNKQLTSHNDFQPYHSRGAPASSVFRTSHNAVRLDIDSLLAVPLILTYPNFSQSKPEGVFINRVDSLFQIRSQQFIWPLSVFRYLCTTVQIPVHNFSFCAALLSLATPTCSRSGYYDNSQQPVP